MKRVTPTEKDYERIAQNVGYNMKAPHDYSSFTEAYDKYFNTPQGTGMQTTKQKTRTWQAYQKLKNLFKQAGGKDLKRDTKYAHKTVVATKESYLKKGAKKSDKIGVDITKYSQPQKKVFSMVGTKKGKVVYGRKTFAIIKGKQQIRIIDRKGQYVSLKR